MLFKREKLDKYGAVYWRKLSLDVLADTTRTISEGNASNYRGKVY